MAEVIDEGDTGSPVRIPSSAVRQLRHAQEGEQIPRGAILLSEREVSELIVRTLDKWQPAREMWSLKYGGGILGVMASASGAVFTIHFRQRMLLRSQARLVSYLPTMIIPFLTTTLAQHSSGFRLLLGGDALRPVCPVCAEIRSVSIQLAAGVVQPFLLSVAASAALAKLTASYPLPPMSDVNAMWKTLLVVCRPLRHTALILAATSGFNAAVITYLQGRAAMHLHAKISETGLFVS